MTPHPKPDQPDANSEAPDGLFAPCALYEALGVYLTATVVFRAINFGRIVLLTWFMSRDAFGILNVILLVANVLTPLCGLGLPDALARYSPRHEVRGSLSAFLGRAGRIVSIIAAAGLIVLLSMSGKLGHSAFALAESGQSTNDATRLAWTSALIVAAQVLYFSLLATLKGLRMFRAMAWTEITHGLLFLMGSIAALALGRRSATDLSLVYIASIAVPLAYFSLGLRDRISGDPRQAAPLEAPRLAAVLLRFGIWTALSGLVWQAMIYYATWALNRGHGAESVAVFSASRQIGQIILILAVSLSTVVMTSITRAWETQGRAAAFERLAGAFRAIGLGLFLICAALSLGRNWIILLFRPEYAAGAEVIPLHMFFFLIGGYLSLLPAHFHLLEKTRRALWPWVIGLAVNIAAASLLAPVTTLATGQPSPGTSSVSTSIWRTLAPRLLIVGTDDPMGLGLAAWCAALAALAALTTCLLLLWREGVRFDRGAVVLFAAVLLLAAKPIILASGAAAIIFIALKTDWLVSRSQRIAWFVQAKAAGGRILGINRPEAH